MGRGGPKGEGEEPVRDMRRSDYGNPGGGRANQVPGWINTFEFSTKTHNASRSMMAVRRRGDQSGAKLDQHFRTVTIGDD